MRRMVEGRVGVVQLVGGGARVWGVPDVIWGINPFETIVGVILVGWAMLAVRSGTILSASPGFPWRREQNPVIYWALVTVVFTMGLLFLIDALVFDL